MGFSGESCPSSARCRGLVDWYALHTVVGASDLGAAHGPEACPAQAWVFAALNDEERRKTYTAFAFLYSLPLLERGLSFDPYVLACVVACVLHVQVRVTFHNRMMPVRLAAQPRIHGCLSFRFDDVCQVERLAQTEPDTFSSLGLDKVASRLPLPSVSCLLVLLLLLACWPGPACKYSWQQLTVCWTDLNCLAVQGNVLLHRRGEGGAA